MTKELIDRFFRRECTAEEAAEVAAYLKANPAVLEEYLSAEEWNTIKQDDPVFADDDFWNETWQDIKRNNKNTEIVRSIKRAVAVASVIALMVITAYYALTNSQETKTATVAELPVSRVKEPEHRTVSNYTKKTMRMVLDDGSAVELSPAASIQYEIPFGKTKRNILLYGQARFIVAKNKAKPFSVFAGGFTTTALGTVFTVWNNNAEKTFVVKLFEGKVVVHSINSNTTGWQNDVYLVAGEQLAFNQLSGKLAINNSVKQKPAAATKPEIKTVDSTYDRLTFTNAPLPKVMHTLAGWYNIHIQYDSAITGKMKFSGMVSRYDSAEVILKVITQANGLNVSKNDTAFIIHKP